MTQVLMAVVEHRRLMELKNSGVVKTNLLKDKADVAFFDLRQAIIDRRLTTEKATGVLRLLSGKTFAAALRKDIEVMFDTRQAIVDHLIAVDVPTKLAPVSEEEKRDLLFLDRAARYSAEADKVLGLFKLHNEVIVDGDTSHVINWLLSNTQRIRDVRLGETK